MKIIPPKPAPMLASPHTDATACLGKMSAGNASVLARQPVYSNVVTEMRPIANGALLVKIAGVVLYVRSAKKTVLFARSSLLTPPSREGIHAGCIFRIRPPMKTAFLVLPLVLLTFTAPSPAQEKPGDGPANQFILTKVRLLPKPGKAALLAGARIVGSNEGPTTAPEEMARIERAPVEDGWFEVTVPPGKVFRYVKIDSAQAAGLALAEVEFYSPSGRLRGNGFGTSVGKDKAAFSFDKALDGDPNTCFESPAEHSYVGRIAVPS